MFQQTNCEGPPYQQEQREVPHSKIVGVHSSLVHLLSSFFLKKKKSCASSSRPANWGDIAWPSEVEDWEDTLLGVGRGKFGIGKATIKNKYNHAKRLYWRSPSWLIYVKIDRIGWYCREGHDDRTDKHNSGCGEGRIGIRPPHILSLTTMYIKIFGALDLASSQYEECVVG